MRMDFISFIRQVCLLPVAAALLWGSCAFGQQTEMLRVTPVRIDVQTPASGATLTLTNSGDRPMSVQVRIFKWRQKTDEDLYTPARGVAASPPMITLKPRSESVLRIVRTDPAPVMKEESYRLVIDQLPDPTLRRQKGSTIAFVVRHNIPVFFTPQGALEPSLNWKVAPVKGGYKVTAVNSGTRHIGFADIQLLAGKTVVGRLDGLAGYALAGASSSFFIPSRLRQKPDRIKAVDINRMPIEDVLR